MYRGDDVILKSKKKSKTVPEVQKKEEKPADRHNSIKPAAREGDFFKEPKGMMKVLKTQFNKMIRSTPNNDHAENKVPASPGS